MKSINQIATEISNNLVCVTNYEKTKLLVIIDRIVEKPYANHRMELNFYSIRYKAEDKNIYVYNKAYEFDDNFDFDYIDNIDFPTDFSVKIIVDSKCDMIRKMLILKLRRLNTIWKK